MDVIDHLRLMIILLAEVTGDQVSHLLLVLDWVHPGVVKDESQVVSDLSLLLDFIVLAKSFTHDSDQHVEEMDQKDKTGKDEE